MAGMDMPVIMCNYEPTDEERERIQARNRVAQIGYIDIWGFSPEPPIRDPDDYSSEEEEKPSIERSSHKKNKKNKKSKKKKRKRKNSDEIQDFDPDESKASDSDDDWVAVKPVEISKVNRQTNEDAPIFMQDGYDMTGIGPGVPKFIHEQIKREHVSKHKGDFIEKAKIPKDFGRALLTGEGEAMAQFVEAGVRIPRRGEIGLTAAEIEHYENQGYVMSGTRHLRMEAIRLRKESQIYNIDERRALGVMHRVEKEKKEYEVIQQFRNMINKKITDRKDALVQQKQKQDKLKRTQKEHLKAREEYSKSSKKSKND